jgi:hypothetical protein
MITGVRWRGRQPSAWAPALVIRLYWNVASERNGAAVLMQALAEPAATDFAAAGSPEGRAWMAALPSLARDLSRQWDLTAAGDLFWHGYSAVVFPVRQGGRPLVLKLAWPRQ